MARALIVVDMQNSFFHPDGAMRQFRGPTLHAEEVIEQSRRAVEEAHRAGYHVVYTRHGYRPNYVDAGERTRRNLAPVMAEGGLLRDTWDTSILDALDVRPDDVVLDKSRFSAFQGTSLQLILSSLNVSQLFVAGVLTNICVESTVRTAHELDYGVTVLADCVSTRSANLHEASLESMRAGQFAAIAPWTKALDR